MRHIEAQQNAARNGGETSPAPVPDNKPARTLEEIAHDAQDRIAANFAAAADEAGGVEANSAELEAQIRELGERNAGLAHQLKQAQEKADTLTAQLYRSEQESLELYRENRQYQIAIVALRKQAAGQGEG